MTFYGASEYSIRELHLRTLNPFPDLVSPRRDFGRKEGSYTSPPVRERERLGMLIEALGVKPNKRCIPGCHHTHFTEQFERCPPQGRLMTYTELEKGSDKNITLLRASDKKTEWGYCPLICGRSTGACSELLDLGSDASTTVLRKLHAGLLGNIVVSSHNSWVVNGFESRFALCRVVLSVVGFSEHLRLGKHFTTVQPRSALSSVTALSKHLLPYQYPPPTSS
jgi:hypothetical protein